MGRQESWVGKIRPRSAGDRASARTCAHRAATFYVSMTHDYDPGSIFNFVNHSGKSSSLALKRDWSIQERTEWRKL